MKNLFLSCIVLLGAMAFTFSPDRPEMITTIAYPDPAEAAPRLNPDPPPAPVKLIFIHHSSGELWLRDDEGGLGIALRDNNYFVSDTNYDWGPNEAVLGGPIGSFTDFGHWPYWFLTKNRLTVEKALMKESAQHSEYSRLEKDPGGQNQIILFKSCFPNSELQGNPEDAPVTTKNKLFGKDASNENHTVGNAKGIYVMLLKYFQEKPDKLFVVITAPPESKELTDDQRAGNARAFNLWLVNDWLKDYPLKNVAVFDFYNVLTSNAGSVEKNDLNQKDGNHHRFNNDQIEYITDQGSNFEAYATAEDSHPLKAGLEKATAEFVPLLNVFYHRWKGK